MPACKSCRAPILWVVAAASGKRMPVDAEPTAEGAVLVLNPPDAAPVGHVLSGDALDMAREGCPERVHRSHFATCPNADTHRNPRR